MIPAHLLVRVYWCWGGCLQSPRGLCGLALASGAQQPGECSEYTTTEKICPLTDSQGGVKRIVHFELGPAGVQDTYIRNDGLSYLVSPQVAAKRCAVSVQRSADRQYSFILG